MKEILLNENKNINNEKNNLELSNNVYNEIIEKQENFFESNIGKIINNGMNIGLRLILPDLIEDQIIQIKDILMKQGVKDGIKTISDSILDFGKSVKGIFTGRFENISQVENAVKNGGVIDITSKVLNSAINLAQKNKLIDSSTAKILQKGKNAILENVDINIKNMLTAQIKSIEKVDKYLNQWKEAYYEKNISKMQKEYKKLENELEKIVPLENIINSARKVENIHKFIINNGNNFELTNIELELAEKLV